MKLLLSVFLLLLSIGWSAELSAQQDYQFTQFTFNKLALNPAYAGMDNVTTLTAVYRRQWTGLEGAPQTINFSAHGPMLNNKAGLGLLLYNDKLGVTDNIGLYLSYSYKLRFRNSVFALGMQGGFLNYRSGLTSLVTLQGGDQVFSSDVSRLLPNIGAGLYWHRADRAYFGLSVPHLLRNNIGVDNVLLTDELAQLYRHVYFMSGIVVDLSSNLKLRPSILVKYIPKVEASAPVDIDMQLSVLIKDRIWLGGAYRLGDSFDFLVEYGLNDQLMAGYAYDLGVNALRAQHTGSHEIMLRYRMAFSDDSHVNPRHIKYF